MKLSSIAIAALLGHVTALDFNQVSLADESLDQLKEKSAALVKELKDAGKDQTKIDECNTQYKPDESLKEAEQTTTYQSLIECLNKLKGGDEGEKKAEEKKPAEGEGDGEKKSEEKPAEKTEEKKGDEITVDTIKADADKLKAKLAGFKKLLEECAKLEPGEDVTDEAEQKEAWNKAKKCLTEKKAAQLKRLQTLKDKVAKMSETVKDEGKKNEARKPLDGIEEKTLKEKILA